jgi:branched-chain amino acid transport system substrate-binding protein
MRHILLLFLLSLTSFGVQANEIVIGVLANTSGTQVVVDSESIKGIRLAVDQINAKGGLLGDKIKLTIKKGNSQTNETQKLAGQLASDNAINYVIDVSSTTDVMAAAPAILNAGKVMLSSSATGTDLLQQFPHNFFLLAFTDNVQAAAAAQFAVNQMHLARAVVLYQQTMPYAKALAGYFNNAYQHFKGETVSTIAFTGNKLNAFQLNAIKKAKPNIIFLAASAENVPLLIQQLRKDKLEQTIIGGDSYLASNIAPLGNSIADNVYYTTHGYFDKNFMEAPMEKFVQQYRAVYKESPSNISSALGYDAMNLLATAIKKAKSTAPNKVTKLMKSLTAFNAVTGELDLSSNPPTKIVSVVKLLNAKARIAAMVIPQYIPQSTSYPNVLPLPIQKRGKE